MTAGDNRRRILYMTTDFFLAQFAGTEAEDSHVKLLGVRGYRILMGDDQTGNDMGIYDDAIVRMIGDKQLDIYDASTDPGKFYINHPMNPAGCAKLQPGLWWYEIGMHLNAYPALVQAKPFCVDRLDIHGVKVGSESGFFGINLHSGGAEPQVGRWSAGCQIIFSPAGPWGATWNGFFDRLRNEMEKCAQNLVPYKLIESLPDGEGPNV